MSFVGLVSVFCLTVDCDPSFVELPANYLNSFGLFEIWFVKVIWVNAKKIWQWSLILVHITFILHFDGNIINLVIILTNIIILLLNFFRNFFWWFKVITFANALVSTSGSMGFYFVEARAGVVVGLFELSHDCCGMFAKRFV